MVRGNNIGIGADGSSNIGNIGDGIDLASTATGSIVGALTSGGAGGNIIAFNGVGRTNGAGIGVQNSSQARILSNSIFSNTGISTGIGIDLSAAGSATDGPNANDNCDGDSGGNNLQNFPIITSATTNGASITIAGDAQLDGDYHFHDRVLLEFSRHQPGKDLPRFDDHIDEWSLQRDLQCDVGSSRRRRVEPQSDCDRSVRQHLRVLGSRCEHDAARGSDR